MKIFEDKEIEMIKESFELRKKNSDIDHINKLNIITSKLSYPIKNLTSLQKAIIRGCIREFAIYPNEENLRKSDYEILSSRKEIEKECLQIDIALNILNKTNKRTKSKQRLFKQTFDTIDKISNSKKVYYSITKNGEIYKVGIITNKNKGLNAELGMTTSLSNFEIGILSEKSFMKSAKPSELVNYLKSYSKENKLTENHNRFIKIMENASA
ncbi:hypothetical protein [Gelidibacter maritimus]|uniref:Uncharacterized protein n=1 Tax=Gelidibacter maritimus TaxID=2761487 RepID=A0A7W2M8Q5_9FLAO|nr:hypothetical protein [Gelidibacter maritimus]MBA6154822.1 hypothetical protein [Gelidibacter maritimus]